MVTMLFDESFSPDMLGHPVRVDGRGLGGGLRGGGGHLCLQGALPRALPPRRLLRERAERRAVLGVVKFSPRSNDLSSVPMKPLRVEKRSRFGFSRGRLHSL